ncbi:MAG: dTMP kinase [Acidiferrobacterales bacterium]
MNRGRFLTLEGIEGAGKSTSLEFIQEQLKSAGIPHLVTREPGGTALGEGLREIMLHRDHLGICADSELLLMFAARAQHLAERIRPALDDGVWVVCDRFTDATYAYQGGGRSIPDDRIRTLEHWVQDGLRPDLTLLFDIPVDQGLARAGRRSVPDRFEREKQEFFERVRRHYLVAAAREPVRIRIIDGALPPGHVQEAIRAIMQEFLP